MRSVQALPGSDSLSMQRQSGVQMPELLQKWLVQLQQQKQQQQRKQQQKEVFSSCC
jgi:hypothetical protein